jgi:uncharacterized protein (TIGR02598 family)
MVTTPSQSQQSKSLGRAGWRPVVQAFSLIEVVLAIGVVAFALLAITALLPNGIMTVRRAENLQATSNIANQLRGQLPLLSFSTNSAGTNTVAELVDTTNYYPIDGLPTTNGDPREYYTANFSTNVNVVGGYTTNVVNTYFQPGNAVSVLVTLTYPPGLLNKTNTFSLLVARQTDN